MAEKKVTILMPVQDEQETLDRCFESIKNQTLNNFDIICINNGSKDRSLEILHKWQNFFGPQSFKIIENETNIGITKSLNQGLDITDTKYVARIDGDDWWEPSKLEKQIVFLEKNPEYGVVGTNYINFKRKIEFKVTVPETDEEIKRTIIKRNPFAHSCVVFRTELIKKLGKYNPDIYMGQDYDLWLRCMPQCKFYNIQEFLCHRSIEGGISFEKQKEQMKQGIKTQTKYIRKYGLPLKNYIYTLELFLVIITPDFIKRLKRKFS